MDKNVIMNKGQITLGIASLLTTVTLVGSVLTAYFTSAINVNNQIAEVRQNLSDQVSTTKVDIATVSTKEANTETRMDRFEAKLDSLLYKNNIDPTPFDVKFKNVTVATTT